VIYDIKFRSSSSILTANKHGERKPNEEKLADNNY